jgi:hypothetical protein
MSFIVDKSTALPSLAEVVEKSGHKLDSSQSGHMMAESTCESPAKHCPSSGVEASSSDEVSQACKAEVFYISTCPSL